MTLVQLLDIIDGMDSRNRERARKQIEQDRKDRERENIKKGGYRK